jgi:hypothetical protein
MRLLWQGTLIGSGRARFAPRALAPSMAGDDHLPRRIEVHGLDHFALRRLRADRCHVRIVEAEHGRHATLTAGHRIAHEFAAYPDEVHRVLEIERARRHQRGELAQAVARHPIGCGAACVAPGAISRDPSDQHDGLRDLGERELLDGSLLRERPKVIAEHAGGGVEGLADDRMRFGPGRHHADRLRPLSRKHERSRHQLPSSSAQAGESIRANAG